MKKDLRENLNKPCLKCKFFSKNKRYCKNGFDTKFKKYFCKYIDISRYESRKIEEEFDKSLARDIAKNMR